MHPDILPLHMEVERDHWWFVARRRIVRDLLAMLQEPGPDVRLLDLGCGTGGNMEELRTLYACHGIELDEAAAEFAAAEYPECRIVCGSIYDPATWPVSEPMDIVLIMDVLEHLDDPQRAVANATEALRPGGHLLVTVPANPKMWSHHDEAHGHRRRYTVDSLAHVLDGHRLERRLLSPFNARLYYPIRVVRYLQKRLRGPGDRGTTGDLRKPSAFVNSLFSRIFAGESSRLQAVLEAKASPYRNGVSLIAVYRRREDSR